MVKYSLKFLLINKKNYNRLFIIMLCFDFRDLYIIYNQSCELIFLILNTKYFKLSNLLQKTYNNSNFKIL